MMIVDGGLTMVDDELVHISDVISWCLLKYMEV